MSRHVKAINVDAELLEKARDAMKSKATPSAPSPQLDVEVIEQALRYYLGRRALEQSQAMSDLSEEHALRLAYEELHELRRERRGAA
jgi:hypothetical protein